MAGLDMTKVDKKDDKLKTTALDLFGTGSRSYVMHYRYGNRPPQLKAFIIEGDLPEAIERAKKHCIAMDYRFCGCYPFVVDLDKQERLRNDDMGFNEL